MVQSIPNAPTINAENIETVLDGVRPFLSVAGGNIVVRSISGVGGLQPVILLKMEGMSWLALLRVIVCSCVLLCFIACYYYVLLCIIMYYYHVLLCVIIVYYC